MRRTLRRRYGRTRTSKMIEGVRHRPYTVSFTTTSGRRVSLTHWSPGQPWLNEEVSRMLSDQDVARGSTVRVKKKGW